MIAAAEQNVAYGILKVLKDVEDVYERAVMMRNVVIVGGGGGVAGIGQRVLEEVQNACEQFAEMGAMRDVVKRIGIKEMSVVGGLVAWTGAWIMCNARINDALLDCTR